MREIEVKFLNIDVAKTQNKLKELGAKKEYDELFEEWLYARPEWKAKRGRVRLRKQSNKLLLAYKETLQETSKGNTEIEFEVSNKNDALEFLSKLGFDEPRYQQKRRIHYVLGGVSIDIDFWPLLPPMIEIESTSLKKAEKVAQQLGFDLNNACNLDAFQIYTQIYKIDLNTIKDLRFDLEK